MFTHQINEVTDAMNSGEPNLSPARRVKRCALTLLAIFSVVIGGAYLTQREGEPRSPYKNAVAQDTSAPAPVRSDTVIARNGERL